MKQNTRFRWLASAALVALFGALALLAQSRADVPPYLDPKRPINARIDDLMTRMTLKEKVGQLNLPCVYVDELGKDIPSKLEACRRFAAGTYTHEIGPGCVYVDELGKDIPSKLEACRRFAAGT